MISHIYCLHDTTSRTSVCKVTNTCVEWLVWNDQFSHLPTPLLTNGKRMPWLHPESSNITSVWHRQVWIFWMNMLALSWWNSDCSDLKKVLTEHGHFGLLNLLELFIIVMCTFMLLLLLPSCYLVQISV